MFVTFISISLLLVFCGGAHLKNERPKSKPQTEDILSDFGISSFGNIDRKTVPDLHWTNDSLHRQRTSFAKEEIDRAYIDDLNVELLMEGMMVGHNGRCYKPIGLRQDQTPRAVAEAIKMSSGDRERKSHREKRTFIPTYVKFEKYWINATIPYYFKSDTFQNLNEAKALIRDTMDYIENSTCARFIEKSSLEIQEMRNQSNYGFITIIGSGQYACGTYLGRYSAYIPYRGYSHPLFLNEQAGCINRATIGHELGHVLGMYHEFMRSDRDEHVTVHFDRISQNGLEAFFKSDTVNRTPFDYGSLLQYSPTGFAINRQEKTLETRDPDLEYLLRASNYLSYYDIMAINKAYKCFDNCPTEKCEYGAVRDETCTCKCPAGLRGATCEDVVNSDICGGIIDIIPGKETILKSPKFKTLPREGAICHWLLKAPKEYSITIEVEDFRMSWNPDTNRCYHWLEINYNLIGQPAPKHCGDSFPRRKISTSKYGQTHLMMLKWDTKTVSGGQREGGFKIKANAYRVYGIQSKGCSKPPNIENAANNYETVGRKNGDIITYQCQYPYTMIGDVASITCQADSTWSNPAFTCKLNEPVLACDFEKDDCGFTQVESSYQWKRTIVEGNAFYRIDLPANTVGTRYHYLLINAPLKKYRTYCLSVSLRRPSGNVGCAEYRIRLFSDFDFELLMRSSKCYDAEWTTYRTTFTATAKPNIYIFTSTLTYSLFNLDLDNIIIREGAC